ncbi:EF-hand calcium-binding domain-containing protein 9 [Orchesella cincta]|uniref:EF-hand calcium-binding domain-containing protein 9 n=1 Tax=Orchesella cincta TaxID=48709 RepID=A0A1D2MW78_ORCCI|nr:EF-hand calcium-binding domain-containing protein 9 [Orchesella cincta]
MRVDCSVLTCIHLDPGYALLSVQNTLTCMEMFNIIDVHRSNKLNDVQFMLLLRNISNLSRYEIDVIFNLLDVDHSGEIEFEEFYLIFCILIANKDSYEKEFIYRHSGTIFQLIDSDASGQISSAEFSHMGVLFNFDHSAIKRIFNEFDISGDKSLDFSEFRLFTMACIDEARAQETREKVKAFAKYRERLLVALEPSLRRFVRTDRLPRPREIEETVVRVRHPYIPGRKDIGRPFRYGIIRQTFNTTREEIRDYFKEKFGKIPCLFCFFGYILCCYCCIEDPLANTGGRSCRCKCKCRCFPCWFVFVRKIWTCCYCIFPCCHCCQPLNDHHQHIARKRKMQWPELTDTDEETELVNGQPQRGYHHHYHHAHHHLDPKTEITSREFDQPESVRESVAFRPKEVKTKLKVKTSGDPSSQETSKRKKMKPTPQPVENPRWCQTQ